jgi:hypothetical protein
MVRGAGKRERASKQARAGAMELLYAVKKWRVEGGGWRMEA